MSRTRVLVLCVCALLLALVGIGAWRLGDDGSPSVAGPPTRVEAVDPAELGERPVLTAADRCGRPATKPFRPLSLTVPGLVPARTVVPLPREADGTPGVPSLGSGKQHVGWDAPGVMPGEPSGKVMLNAHAWPDRSALGDRFVADLEVGERLVLSGAGGATLCYDVTERTEVPVDDEAMIARVFAPGGPAQAVIIVCSGTRTGPGEWSHRTLWFARPVAAT